MKKYLPPLVLLIISYNVLNLILIPIESILGNYEFDESIFSVGFWNPIFKEIIAIVVISVITKLVYKILIKEESNTMYLLCGLAIEMSIKLQQFIKWQSANKVFGHFINFPLYSTVILSVIIFTPLAVHIVWQKAANKSLKDAP